MPNRRLVTRALSVLAIALTMAACGGREGLTAEGHFNVDDDVRDIHTAIQLVEESRIDSGGRITGSCEIREVDGIRSVAIDLYTDGGGADNQLGHASITGISGSGTLALTAQVGSVTYSSGACAASVAAIDTNGTAVLATAGACTLTSAGTETFDANVDLAVFGCRVVTE